MAKYIDFFADGYSCQVAANSDFVVKLMTHGTIFLWNLIVSTYIWITLEANCFLLSVVLYAFMYRRDGFYRSAHLLCFTAALSWPMPL